MMLSVVRRAQPTDREGLRVVVVVAVRGLPAPLARLTLHVPASDGVPQVEVRATCQRISFDPGTRMGAVPERVAFRFGHGLSGRMSGAVDDLSIGRSVRGGAIPPW